MSFQKLAGLFAVILLFMTIADAQSESQNVPNEWRTLAEQTAYRQTWNYEDTIAFARRLDQASDKIV
jgi:hypothetical protein